MEEWAYKEGAIQYVGSEIERMAEDLHLSETVTKQALLMYARTLEEEVNFSRLDDISAACLYGAVRSNPQRVGATFRDVASVARIKDSRIHTVSTRVFEELGLKVPPPDPRTTIESACETLDLEEYSDTLVQILDDIDDDGFNLAPTTVAASIVFAGKHLESSSYDVTQKMVADAVGTTEVSLRKQYTEILRRIHEQTDWSIATHRFHTAKHGLAVLEDDLGISKNITANASQRIADSDFSKEGRSLEGIVCAAVYLAAEDAGNPVDVSELIDPIGVTEPTVRKYMRELE